MVFEGLMYYYLRYNLYNSKKYFCYLYYLNIL